MKKPLEVKFGSIYTTSGRLEMIDNIGLVINKKLGFVKYGSLDVIAGESNLRNYYNKTVKSLRGIGLDDEADNLVLIEFDRYDGVLNIEEICTLCNYIIMVLHDYSDIMNLMSLDENGLRSEISRLQSMGY